MHPVAARRLRDFASALTISVPNCALSDSKMLRTLSCSLSRASGNCCVCRERACQSSFRFLLFGVCGVKSSRLHRSAFAQRGYCPIVPLGLKSASSCAARRLGRGASALHTIYLLHIVEKLLL